jgi:hypothetical protein
MHGKWGTRDMFSEKYFWGLLADGLSSARVVGQVSTSRLHCHVSAGFGYKDHFRVADHPEGGQTGQYKGVSRYLFAETSYKPTYGPDRTALTAGCRFPSQVE